MKSYYDEIRPERERRKSADFPIGVQWRVLDEWESSRFRRDCLVSVYIFVVGLAIVAAIGIFSGVRHPDDGGYVVGVISGVAAILVYVFGRGSVDGTVKNAIMCRCRVSDVARWGAGVGQPNFNVTVHLTLASGPFTFRTALARSFLKSLHNGEGILMVDARNPSRILSCGELL